jgi:hypothetical protein
MSQDQERMLGPYVYMPLARNYIRLLQLDPTADGTPIGRIEHIPLRIGLLTRKYNALSYCWGSGEAVKSFICDGKVMLIRENLAECLKHLAASDRVVPIWIDAVCINQLDDAEKLQQIQLMARIYQQASLVVVWLCSELDGSALAVRQIQGLLDHLYSFSLTEAAIDGCGPELLLALGRIFAQPWFERVWTLQEATLARKILVLIGDETLKWSVFEKLVTALTRVQERCSTPLLLTEKLWPGNEFKDCTALTAIPNIDTCKTTYDARFVPQLARICRNRKCSDPKDRVYGILGMLPKQLQRSIAARANQQDTVAKLYVIFMAFVLENDSVLLGLSMVESKARDPSLPTWCADLHQLPSTNILAGYYAYEAGENIVRPPANRTTWDACRPAELGLKIATLESVAHIVDGRWFDLEDLSSTRCSSASTINKVQQNVTWVAACMQAAHTHMSKTRTNGESSVKEAVLRTLIADRNQVSAKGRFERSQNASVAADWLRIAQAETPVEDLPGGVVRGLKHISRACIGRRFCITSKGRLCLAPVKVQNEDVVCLVQGAKVPFVIRPVAGETNRFTLVGEAYLDGVMYGELFKRSRTDFLKITQSNELTGGLKWIKSTLV